MDEMLKWLASPELIRNVGILLLFVLSGLLMLFMAFRKSQPPQTAQLVGTMLVVALSALAHDAWVYTLSVFVVATLITDTAFLRHLAAIFFDREWGMRQATPEERAEKMKQEATEVAPDGSPPPDRRTSPAGGQQLGMVVGDESFEGPSPGRPAPTPENFEGKALKALVDTKLFDKHGFSVHVALAVPDVKPLVADAIVKRGRTEFIVEVRSSRALSSLQGAMWQVFDCMNRYRIIHRHRGVGSRVKGIVIVLADAPPVPGVPYDQFILRFNPESREFENLEDLAEWIDVEL